MVSLAGYDPSALRGPQRRAARRGATEDIYAEVATLGPVEEIRERVEAELEAGRDPKSLPLRIVRANPARR